MATKVLTITTPWTPIPNPAGPQLVMISNDGWTMSAIKGSPHKQIDTVQKFVKVGINAAHFTTYCQAYQEPGPSKTTTITYSGTVVSAMDFQHNGNNIHIAIPDP